MFLLPSILIGFLFALLLGGDVSRVLEVRLRGAWAIAVALAVQLVLFSGLLRVPAGAKSALHVGTYALLLVFAALNRRVLALVPLMLGMLLNAIAITANRGSMSVTSSAAAAAGVAPRSYQNVSTHSHHLQFLGDVFALPRRLPLSNTFSVGDLLISFGMIAFIVAVSTRDGAGERPFALHGTFEPLRLSAYRHLVLGKLISTVGDWLTVATVIGWIYSQTRSTAAVAITLIARLAPPILGGGVAAYVVDRLPKGRLLLWIELARGGVAVVALAGVLGDHLPLVLAALAVSGALAAVSGATTPSLMPSLVPPEQLPAANAGLGLVKNTAMALGAGGAGVALALASAPVALLVDVATFVVAAALYRHLRSAAPQRTEAASRSAWRHLVHRPQILLLIASFSAATFATGLTNTILPKFLARNAGLGGGGGGGGYGFGIAALAGGLAVGELLVGFSRIGRTAGRWIGVGLLMAGALLVTLAASDHRPSIFLFLALVGLIDGSTDILYDLVIQREADPEYYGAAFGLSSALTATTMVGGFALAVPLASLVSPGGVVALSGGAFAVAGVIAITAIVRRRPAPAPAGAVAPAA